MASFGYNLYLIVKQVDSQTGEEWEEEPYFLRLAYSDWKQANDAKTLLEKVYGEGSIEINTRQLPMILPE